MDRVTVRAPAAGLPAARPQFRQGGRGWHSCVTPPSAATGGRSRPLVFRARDRRRLHARAPGSEERGDGGSQEGWGEPGGHTWFTEEDAREQKLLEARAEILLWVSLPVTYLFLSEATQEPLILVIPVLLNVFPPTRGLLAPVFSKAATIVRRKLGGGEAQRRGRPRGPRTVRRLFCGAAQSWWDPRPPQPPPGSSDLGGDTPRGGYRRAAAPGPSAASAGTRAGAAASAATWRAPPADSGFPDRSAGGPGDWAPVGGSAAAGRAGGGLRGTGFGAVGPTGSQPEWSPVSVDRGSQETPWESAVGASAADVASVWGRVIDIPGSAAPPPRPGLQLFTGDGAAPRAASPDAAAPAGPPGGAAPYGYRESGLGASSSASYPGAPEYWGGRVEGRSGVAREMRGPQRAGGSGRRVGDAPPSRVQTRRTDGPPPRRRRQPADPGAQAARGAWDQSGGRSLWESAVAEAGETAGRLWADVWPASARGPEPAASSWSWDGGQPGGGSAPRRAPAGPQERPGREWSGAGEPPEPSGAAAGPGLGGAEFGAAEARRRRRARPGRFPAGSPSADEGVDPAAWREALSRWDAGLARTAAGEEDESVAGAARRYWEAIFVPPKGGGGQGGGGGRRADPPWLRALFKTFPFLKAWGGFA